MNKIKIFLSLLLSGAKVVFNKLSSSKIKISKNKKTKIKQNETKNVSIAIQRNDECEISENKFFKK